MVVAGHDFDDDDPVDLEEVWFNSTVAERGRRAGERDGQNNRCPGERFSQGDSVDGDGGKQLAGGVHNLEGLPTKPAILRPSTHLRTEERLGDRIADVG
jgi:hypothetical protein